MSHLRAAVFDMDGLMFNTEDVYTLVGAELMGRRGREYTEELKDAIMGLPPRKTFETMIDWHDLDDGWEEMAVESNKIFINLLGDHLAPLPGLFELLDALESADIPKAIATSSQPTLVEPCLTPFDLRRRFDFVLTSEDVTHGKPHPEIYRTAAERFGLPPAEMLVLEDSENGARAAAAAGAFTVAVPGEHSRNHDFSVARLVIDSLADRRLYDALGIPASLR